MNDDMVDDEHNYVRMYNMWMRMDRERSYNVRA